MARQPMRNRLMNVKIPAHVAQSVDPIAEQIGASKIEVMIALPNEGPQRMKRYLAAAGVLLCVAVFSAAAANAKVFCTAKVHGKGPYALSDPTNTQAEAYWQNGAFHQVEQPCGGMPELTTHADGTYGQDVAFDRPYCGCGIWRWNGCDYLYTPQAGKVDPGLTGPWPNGWWNGWVNTTNANADNPDPTNQCVRSGPYWPRQWPTAGGRYQGVIEQINTFLDQTGCDDLTIVTHSNGGNIVRWGFSYTQLYTMTSCKQGGSSSGALDPGCIARRQHQLRVINATTHVFELHVPATGSEAANVVQSLTTGNYSWMTGWIADWLGTPYDRATTELTTNAMLVRNTNFMYGTSNPLRPWPIYTADGIPLRVARWIAIGSGLNTATMLEDAGHIEDYELQGAATVVPFPGNNDGLVSYASQIAVYSGNTDIWQALGQHDIAAAGTFSGLGNNGNNHHHARLGAAGGGNGGLWTPVYSRQENTTPMPLSWPGPAFPAPGGPGGAYCSRQDYYDIYGHPTISYFTCPTWPVPSYASHGLPIRACPDSTCLFNAARGYPAGGDEAFWISAFVEARAASYCGPPLTNLSNIQSGQWTNYYRNYVSWQASPIQYGPTWYLVGQQLLYEPAYSPNSGRQVCGWAC
jgi:hypothetical protein